MLTSECTINMCHRSYWCAHARRALEGFGHELALRGNLWRPLEAGGSQEPTASCTLNAFTQARSGESVYTAQLPVAAAALVPPPPRLDCRRRSRRWQSRPGMALAPMPMPMTEPKASVKLSSEHWHGQKALRPNGHGRGISTTSLLLSPLPRRCRRHADKGYDRGITQTRSPRAPP